MIRDRRGLEPRHATSARRPGEAAGRRAVRRDHRGERTDGRVASCDLVGRAVFSVLAITDGDGQRWEMRPNRRVLPTRWTVTDPEGRVAMCCPCSMLRLPAEREPRRGLPGRLGSLLASSERGIVSAGRDHLLPAPVALGMLLLLDELTDPSGG